MKSIISIYSFIINCLIGNLTISTGIDELRKVLGRADDSGKGIGKVVIERYFGGSLEVSFLNQTVVMVGIYFSKGILASDSINEYISLDIPQEVLDNSSALLCWLEEHNLSASLLYSDDESSSWKISNGIVLTYINGSLDSIQLSS